MRALIVLRCGSGSIHKSWIERVRRHCDIAFVAFDDADFSGDRPTYAARYPGTKLTGTAEFFADRPDLIEAYDYFWLVEDDLFIPYETVVGALRFAELMRPVLCAPSLAPQSFYTYPITVQNDALFCRGTDFVECMAPLMSREFLKRTLEQFTVYPIWGIEHFWRHLLWEMRQVAFILDAYPIVHTRPVRGGSLYRLEAEMGIDSAQDMKDAEERYSRPFGRFPNTLFGVTSTPLPDYVTGADLRLALWSGAAAFLRADPANLATFDWNVINHTYFANDMFSRFLTFSGVQDLLRLPRESEFEAELMVRDWSYGDRQAGQYAEKIKLRPFGAIGNYLHDNEYSWTVDGTDLLFLSREGMVTTRFTRRHLDEGKIVFEGRHELADGAVHYLREH